MAVSIDTVYQKVLAIANKEQRGYITPQEFNLFADQAQMDIFEQYFYDINQFGRAPGNNTEYSDMLTLLEEKIAIFDQFKVAMSAVSGNQLTLPTDVYRLGTVFYGGAGFDVEVEKVNKKDLEYMLRTALYAPVETRPVYVKKSQTLLKLFPASPPTLASYTATNVTCNYIKKPATPKWTYTVVVNKALFNSTTDTQNFELHESEEEKLVIKILQLAGVAIKDTLLIQTASAAESSNVQQEKQ
jgi:hypothetical protein